MRKEKPSRTAYKVALNILALRQNSQVQDILPNGIIDTTEKLLIASGAANERVIRWHRSSKMTSIYKAFDWLLPDQFEAFAHRKAFCEIQVRDSIDAGATQVLVLGAGYDTMSFRLAPEFPEVNFFEIDHPATALLKEKGIQKMGKHDNHHLISEDLSEHKLVDVLESNKSWNNEAHTVIIAEGLLMYLPPSVVNDLLMQCASISGEDSRMAFTYIGKREDGQPDAGRCTSFMLWTLKISGEPWLWCIQPENIGKILNENGWAYMPEPVGEINKRGVEYFGAARRN